MPRITSSTGASSSLSSSSSSAGSGGGKSGTSLLDFGAGSSAAEVIVTGVSEARLTSVVIPSMRLDATADHTIDDLQSDPIRVLVKDLVDGVGFTIYGTMDNARANGSYKIDWQLTN